MKQEVRESVETTREAPKSTFTIEHKRNLSKSMKGRIPWNKGLTKKDPRVLKNTLATQSNPNLRKNLSKAAMGHKSTFNRKHTQEEIDKISEKQTGRKHNYKVWNKDLTKETDIRLKKIGRNISKSLMKLPKEKRGEIGRKGRAGYKTVRVSKAEKTVCEILEKKEIQFIPQYKVQKEGFLTYVDIYIPKLNLCVYLDGIWWHRNSKEKDRNVTKTLRRLGYKVKRFKTIREEKVNSIVKYILDDDIVRHSK
jgi:very-short-patch-repair endonuclease